MSDWEGAATTVPLLVAEDGAGPLLVVVTGAPGCAHAAAISCPSPLESDLYLGREVWGKTGGAPTLLRYQHRRL